MKLIACVDPWFGIGYNNQLLYRFPEDMLRFKAKTVGKTVIMGNNTFKSIGKPLPYRDNIVITHDSSTERLKKYEDICKADRSTIKFMSIMEVLNEFKDKDTKNVYIIGGSEIYNYFLPLCDTLVLTVVHNESKARDSYIENLSFSCSPECGVSIPTEVFYNKNADRISYSLDYNSFMAKKLFSPSTGYYFDFMTYRRN